MNGCYLRLHSACDIVARIFLLDVQKIAHGVRNLNFPIIISGRELRVLARELETERQIRFHRILRIDGENDLPSLLLIDSRGCGRGELGGGSLLGVQEIFV